MSAAPRREMELLAVALGLGLLADLALRAFPVGLNATVVTVALVAALLAFHPCPRGFTRWACGLAALAAGLGFCWRDSPVLKSLDGLVVAVALALLASDLGLGPSLSSYLLRIGRTSAYVVPGPLPALTEVPWSEVRGPVSWRVVFGLARGLALAAPIVAVFALLLASADTVFALRLRELIDVDLVELAGHAAGTVVLAWVAAGILWAGFASPPGGSLPRRAPWLSLGSIEIGVVLGLLDLLFAGFVWVQLRYLFGGAAWVASVAGLTYSQYARRGFFELVAVTALALPLLLVAHWLLGHARSAVRRTVLGLAAVQVFLVLVMLASALERMRVYRTEYGQTQLRFYTTAFMLWLGVLLVCFLLTVLRGSRGAFARVVLGSGLAAIVLLHAVNPDGRIVIANRDAPTAFDVAYALGLSADAVPALLQTATALPPESHRRLTQVLGSRWSAPDDHDLRTWSLSRANARRLVQEAGRPREVIR